MTWPDVAALVLAFAVSGFFFWLMELHIRHARAQTGDQPSTAASTPAHTDTPAVDGEELYTYALDDLQSEVRECDVWVVRHDGFLVCSVVESIDGEATARMIAEALNARREPIDVQLTTAESRCIVCKQYGGNNLVVCERCHDEPKDRMKVAERIERAVDAYLLTRNQYPYGDEQDRDGMRAVIADALKGEG